MTTLEASLDAEAEAFDRRIRERLAAGFVPDLRRAVKCDYFYKSFWRDPHFARLHMGHKADLFLRMLQRHGGEGQRVLDVGCGAGYIALELARNGYHVTGIDLSTASLEAAKETLASNPYTENFGSLEYRRLPFEAVTGDYDAILFSGAIHHFHDPEAIICRAMRLLPTDGLLLCGEPCHEAWRREDAAQVALIRSLLALTGFWYEPLTPGTEGDATALETMIADIHSEYVLERDKNEAGGQSPNDNASSGQDILDALERHFTRLEYFPADSFLYRMLGGLRGPDSVTHRLADFLAAYDRYSVREGFLRPNGFYFAGRPKGDASLSVGGAA